MKIQVRSNVFETNSSSMHSLVIKKNGHYITSEEFKEQAYIGEDGIIHTYSDDLSYGRYPFQILTDVKDKAFYVLASKCLYKKDEVYNEVVEAIKSIYPDFVDFDLKFETETYKKSSFDENYMKRHFGEGNYISCDDRWVAWGYDIGYVDEDILSDFLKNENITIKEFITNSKYIVIVDGDEYCVYKTMKANGLINKDNIEKEYCPNSYCEND